VSGRRSTSSNSDILVVEEAGADSSDHLQTKFLPMALIADVLDESLSNTPAECIASSSEKKHLPFVYLM